MRRQGCVSVQLVVTVVTVVTVVGVQGYLQLTPTATAPPPHTQGQQQQQQPSQNTVPVTPASTFSIPRPPPPSPPPPHAHTLNNGMASQVEHSGTGKEKYEGGRKEIYDDEGSRTLNIRDQGLSESVMRKRDETEGKNEKVRKILIEEVRTKQEEESSQETVVQEETRVRQEERSEEKEVEETVATREARLDERQLRKRSVNLCAGYKSHQNQGHNPNHNHNQHPGEDMDDIDMRRWTAPTPVTLPGMQVCQRVPRWENDMGTAPPHVCDLCPVTGDFKNPLDPCTCVGNSGTLAGKISITCPPTIVTLDQIKDIFTHTNFISEHVFRFTLQGSNVSGVLTKDLWGPLDFVQVLLNNNHITHVDNFVFNSSAETLTTLNLDNNEIQVYANTNVNDLPNLTTLILSRNDLQVIYSGQFVYSSLRALHLSNNLIHTIGENSFAALDKLETLKLDNNKLTEIGDYNFHFYNHSPDNYILDIDLSSNMIRSISQTGFLGLKMVQIDLQYNQLTTIPEVIFKPIILDSSYFAQFFFCGNDIVCDCSLLWAIDDSIKACFDNFYCTNNRIPFYALEASDLGNCTLVRK